MAERLADQVSGEASRALQEEIDFLIQVDEDLAKVTGPEWVHGPAIRRAQAKRKECQSLTELLQDPIDTDRLSAEALDDQIRELLKDYAAGPASLPTQQADTDRKPSKELFPAIVDAINKAKTSNVSLEGVAFYYVGLKLQVLQGARRKRLDEYVEALESQGASRMTSELQTRRRNLERTPVGSSSRVQGNRGGLIVPDLWHEERQFAESFIDRLEVRLRFLGGDAALDATDLATEEKRLSVERVQRQRQAESREPPPVGEKERRPMSEKDRAEAAMGPLREVYDTYLPKIKKAQEEGNEQEARDWQRLMQSRLDTLRGQL